MTFIDFYLLCRFRERGFPFFDLFSTSPGVSRWGGTAGADSTSCADAPAAADVDAVGKRSISSVLMTVTRLRSLLSDFGGSPEAVGKTGMKEAILRSFFEAARLVWSAIPPAHSPSSLSSGWDSTLTMLISWASVDSSWTWCQNTTLFSSSLMLPIKKMSQDVSLYQIHLKHIKPKPSQFEQLTLL